MNEVAAPPMPASVRRSRRVPVVWAIPILAIGIGAWLAWDTLSKQGPTIRISFDSAEGLQAGQSQLKFKDITLGTVQSLELTPDHRRVIVKVATTRQAIPLLTEQTVFWVVKPRLFAGNISGLETLLSGAYIGMLPAQAQGKSQRSFTGSENPPVLQADVPGRVFLLKADRLGSISLGSPIFFRDLSVGEVLGWDIADMAESVTIRAFVRAPFDSYVHDESRFWNASGISLKIGGSGVELQVESLRAIFLGGIAFDMPENDGAAASADQHVFPLFADRAAANAASYNRKIPLVSYFPGSVRGLAPGAEVTLHGLPVGHVTDVRLTYDPKRNAIVAPVRYEIEPERILGVGNKAIFKTPGEAAEVMVKRGLRATLDSASLITGQQLVALELVNDTASPATVTMEGSDFVLPTVPGGGFAGLQALATELLSNVNAIPFKQIGDDLESILNSASDLTRSPQMRQSLTALSATINGVEQLVAHLDSSVDPTLRKLPETLVGLQRTLMSVNKLALSVDSGYGSNTQFNRDLDRLLTQLSDAVRSIRSLADMLSRHPEALIKGRPPGGIE